MRVAFYAPMKPPDHPTPSGDRRMARLLMAALRRGGHQVVLASRLRAYEGRGDGAAQARIEARAAPIRARLLDRWHRDAAARPDAFLTYHLYHKAPDWLGPALSATLGIPYLVVEGSYARKQRDGPWRAGLAQSVIGLTQARWLLTLTPEDGEGLDTLGLGARIRPFPPFLDCRTHPATPPRAGPGPVRLLAVGMMRAGDKAQSYHLLAAALGRIRHPDWTLTLVGDGPARPDILAAFAAAGVDPARLDRAGAQPAAAMPALYGRADIMVWPAVNEAYGMALLEAQACGLPVIAGRERGVGQIVVDGVTGCLTPPRDVAALAAAIAGLLADPDRRQHMARAAARQARERHDITAAARRLSEALETTG